MRWKIKGNEKEELMATKKEKEKEIIEKRRRK